MKHPSPEAGILAIVSRQFACATASVSSEGDAASAEEADMMMSKPSVYE
jgi:hypothetical protein